MKRQSQSSRLRREEEAEEEGDDSAQVADASPKARIKPRPTSTTSTKAKTSGIVGSATGGRMAMKSREGKYPAPQALAAAVPLDADVATRPHRQKRHGSALSHIVEKWRGLVAHRDCADRLFLRRRRNHHAERGGDSARAARTGETTRGSEAGRYVFCR